MIRTDLNTIKLEELDKLNNKFNVEFKNYIKNSELLENYISFYIAERINCKFLFSTDLNDIISSALDDLSQFKVSECDKEKIKIILKKKYNYIILKEKPLDIKKINNFNDIV